MLVMKTSSRAGFPAGWLALPELLTAVLGQGYRNRGVC